MNTEHDKMATMHVVTEDVAVDTPVVEANPDVDTSASDGVPDADPHREPTGPTAAELLNERERDILRGRGFTSNLAEELARPVTPSYPPGWNPAHPMGLMHPQDVQAMQRRQSIPVLPGLPPAPVPAVPLVAPVPTAMEPSLSAQQSRYVSHETGCANVRREVTLPTMPAAYEHTEELRRLLVVSQSVAEVWATLGDVALGEVAHAAPGLHGLVINTTSFASQALEALDRAVARPADWVEAFEKIVAAASRHHAWRLLGLASGALMAGPFTPLWRNAVDWCLAYWDAG